MTTANGITTAAAFQDLNATGEVHHYWGGDDVLGTAQVYALGLERFRFDSTTSVRSHGWYVDGLRGQLQVGPERQALTAASLIVTKNPLLPVLELVSAVGDSNTALEYLGPVEAPANAVAVAIDRYDPDFPDFGAFRKVYIIDLGTLTVTQTVETVAVSLQDKIARQYAYQDFITVGGITVPTTISESVSGQTTWKLHLTNVAINPGVAGDLFQF